MAGHSKWANIKHRKERSDAQKGKIFSRIAKEIISAVKMGGGDPRSNARLRLAIQKAKAVNFPSESIERNIKKGSAAETADYETVTYEIYAHGGVGMIVEAMTDNKNRTASDMRIALNKRGGTLASPGSVSFNFDRKGVISVDSQADEEKLFQLALDSGAEDFEKEAGGYMITTDPSELYAVKEKLEAAGLSSSEAEIAMIPKNLIECSEENRQQNLALIEWLEELDDVNAVYHNMDL
jgi:YebC/PmpR family DNA-binding regulatory protein